MAQFWEIIKNTIFRAFLSLFWANENLPEKSSSVTFQCLWSPNFMKKTNSNFEKLTKKSIFRPFLPFFWQTRIFPKNPALPFLSVYGPLTSFKKSDKTNDTILRN